MPYNGKVYYHQHNSVFVCVTVCVCVCVCVLTENVCTHMTTTTVNNCRPALIMPESMKRIWCTFSIIVCTSITCATTRITNCAATVSVEAAIRVDHESYWWPAGLQGICWVSDSWKRKPLAILTSDWANRYSRIMTMQRQQTLQSCVPDGEIGQGCTFRCCIIRHKECWLKINEIHRKMMTSDGERRHLLEYVQSRERQKQTSTALR